MTDTTTAAPITLSPAEKGLLTKLVKAKAPIEKTALMEGVTSSEGSFKVMLVNLRKKGFNVTSPTGKGVKGVYSLDDAGKTAAKGLL